MAKLMTMTICRKFPTNKPDKIHNQNEGNSAPMSHQPLPRRAFVTFSASAMLLLSAATGGSAKTPAENFVETVGNRVLAAARAGSVSQFRSLLQANAAISTIAIFSLGPYRKKLPAARKREYYNLVAKNISRVFAAHSKKLAARKLTITSSRTKGRSTIVKTRVTYSSGKTSNVTWRLVNRGGSYKIFDVNVQGIWLANTQKTDFTSLLRRNNGNIDALFSYLRK
jgi:phospholipid transport system substrate-binding protein